jgi:XapX domain-containing protein
MMQLALLSLLTGMLVGALFIFVKLPVPAPPTIAGVAGIFGIFLGAELAKKILSMLG